MSGESEVQYRKLGKSGLEVSEICFGVMGFTGKGGWDHVAKTDQQDADRLTAEAIDRGVNFFDTADIYSSGNSEKMLGHALQGKRHKVLIASKCGFRMKEGPMGDGLSRSRILEACEASLRRLKTDYIDLYQIHSFDFQVPLEETIGTFDLLVKQGRVRYIGLSNFTGWQLMKAMALCDKYNWEPFISLQAYYSLLGRDLEFELVPACIDQGLGILPWSPLHGGILSGKYRDKAKWPKNTRLKGPGEHLPYDIKKGEKILTVLDKIAAGRGMSISQIALNFLLQKPAVCSVVIGARNQKQLRENIAAGGWALDREEMQLLDQVSAPPKPYPQWYFDIFRKNRMG